MRFSSTIRRTLPRQPIGPERGGSRTGRRLLRALWLLALLLGVGARPAQALGKTVDPSGAADPDASGLSPSQRTTALLARVQLAQKQLTALEADFIQWRESEFLNAPEESRGTFAYRAPDLVLWNYLSPKPMSLVIRDDEMLTWYEDLGKAERVKVGRASSQVLRYLNASGSLESLMKYFTVVIAFPPGKEEPYKLDLTPRYARIQKRLKGMTLWISRTDFLPVRVRYIEASGDITEYRFEEMKLNGEIPLARFELEIPKEVVIQEVDLDRGRSARP